MIEDSLYYLEIYINWKDKKNLCQNISKESISFFTVTFITRYAESYLLKSSLFSFFLLNSIAEPMSSSSMKLEQHLKISVLESTSSEFYSSL